MSAAVAAALVSAIGGIIIAFTQANDDPNNAKTESTSSPAAVPSPQIALDRFGTEALQPPPRVALAWQGASSGLRTDQTIVVIGEFAGQTG